MYGRIPISNSIPWKPGRAPPSDARHLRASPGGKPRSLTKIWAGSIFLTSAITRSTSSSFPMMTRPKQFSLIITPFATSYARIATSDGVTLYDSTTTYRVTVPTFAGL